MHTCNVKKIVLLIFVSLFLLSATLGTSFITQAAYEQTINSDSVDPFPQAGKFYTLVGRAVYWEIVGGENITSHEDEILKWSVRDVVGDVVFANYTYVNLYINPETGENHAITLDFDHEISTNRTILSVYWKWMGFTTAGFLGSGERPLDENVGEHTHAWFPKNLSVGDYVPVGWEYDSTFLDDMLYEVVGEEVIQILGKRQDCWIARMPPSITIDGARIRTDTFWVDKDTGVPLKIYSKERFLDDSSGFTDEYVLVNTNINLGPESTQPLSPTYTLTVPTTPGFPEAGKFYTWYHLEEGWYMSGAINITYYWEGFFSWWVVDVIYDEARVYCISWHDDISEGEGLEELERVEISYLSYRISISTREILDAAGLRYVVNMTSLTYDGPYDLTSDLAGDIGEETYCWLPTNLYLGAYVNITQTYDKPWRVDNATFTVIDEEIVNAPDEPQACWELYLPSTSSIDGTWNYSETWYSDKDTGIFLRFFWKGWAVDGNSAFEAPIQLVNTNVDLGPPTYYLTIVSTEGGTTDPFPGTYNYTAGSSVNVTAIPEAGYSFDYWLLDEEEKTENPITIVIDANHTLEAFFARNNPPYQPQLSITPSLDVEDNDDLIVTVIGPTPADPDGDAVTYTYRWFVDVGTGEFLDDELAGRGDHTGNMVPAADTAVGDIWRVEVTPIDEHGAVGPNATATWQVVYDATKPVANAGPDQTVVEGIVVSFDAGDSSDNVGIVSYEWDFGDETTGTGKTVIHTYTEPGTYPVTLTVKDAAGNSDTDSIIITVERDTDGDGTPDVTDTDDDNDGVNDSEDAFPLDPTETVDTDGDGIGNNADTDDDDDGVLDVNDAFPLDPTESVDTDRDGVGDNADTDDDNDNVPDAQDDFPLDPLESFDTDGDGIGNNADTDDDNDEVSDDDDAFPLDSSESTDTDADGIGNNADTDDDGDGIPDVWEIDNGLDPLDDQDASLDPDNDGLINLQEYLENMDPNVYDGEAIREPRSVYIVALVAVVGASLTAAAAALASLGGLGQSFNSAVSKLPIPDELKEFLKLYGEEIFETVDKVKLEALEKVPFITKGELVALGISASITTIVLSFVEANGLPRFLNPSVLADVIPSTLLSVCMVSIAAELSEALCARTCSVYRQFRLWMYGLGVFLISGLLFLFPFASPGITRYQSGEISSKTKGLIVLSKMLIILTLTIPFAGFFMLGFKIIGDAGLLLTLITVCYSLVPLKPVAGKAVFDYRKEVSLIALVSAGILFFSFAFRLLPPVTYLSVGVVSVFLSAITLDQLRKTHPK